MKRKSILLVLVLGAFAVNIFCCCIAKTAILQLMGKQSCPSCTKKANHENPNQVLCMVKAPFTEAVKIFSFTPSSLFWGLMLLVFAPLVQPYRPSLIYLHSPPGRRKDSPLYIRLTNLRL